MWMSAQLTVQFDKKANQTAEYGTFRRDLGCGKPGQLIFRCAKSFSGAEKYLQERLRCALGAGIKVWAARQSA